MKPAADVANATVPTKGPRIIAVANQKGGVGKSTTAVSLAAALAELGEKVLVVDLDPQGNASTGLGIRHEAREVTVYDVLAAEAPIEGAIVPTALENLSAIPSTIDLAGAEIELVSQFSRELRLRRALEPLGTGAFDFILLDCPPSLGLLTVNALAAAEELIVPIQCEYYALEGLGQLLRNVRLVQQNVNQELRLTGIVMTMFDPRTKLSEQVVTEVRKYFGDRVYDTVIPRTVRLSEAPGFGQPITVYDPRSKGARSYRDLAKEVVAKLPQEGPLPVIDELPSVILPPPEPEPARAPRPLRQGDEVEAGESGETAGSRDPAVGGETSDAAQPVSLDDGSTGAEGEMQGERADAATAAEAVSRLEPEPAVEQDVEIGPTSPTHSLAERTATPLPQGAGPADASIPGAWEASAREVGVAPGFGNGSDSGQAGPGGRDRAERAEDGQPDADPEVASEHDGMKHDTGAPQPEPEPAPRKRWSLFRRGGNR